jgi:hypothetical protein
MQIYWFIILSFVFTDAALAEFCRYRGPRTLGALGIKEASGLGVSTRFNRLYHTNDSGDGPYIYATNFNGAMLKKMRVAGVTPSDNEDLSLGPCQDKECIYVGDIGDNNLRRGGGIKIAVVEEPETLETNLPLFAKFTLKYPDGAHNAEAMSVHPNGNLYVVTKTAKTQVFYIPKEELWTNPNATKMMTFVGNLNLGNNLVTGMSISPDGSKFILLTYSQAIEYNIDLGEPEGLDFTKLQNGIDYQKIAIKRLAQQEAISYVDETRFLYTSELRASTVAPVMQMECSP